MIGGTTAISFSPNNVMVLWATPKPGFTVDVSSDADSLDVEFRSDSHRSKIQAWWDNGPQWLIREREDNGGGGGNNFGTTSTTQGP